MRLGQTGRRLWGEVGLAWGEAGTVGFGPLPNNSGALAGAPGPQGRESFPPPLAGEGEGGGEKS